MYDGNLIRCKNVETNYMECCCCETPIELGAIYYYVDEEFVFCSEECLQEKEKLMEDIL